MFMFEWFPSAISRVYARSGIRIPCANQKDHDKEGSRLKKAYEILPESVGENLYFSPKIVNFASFYQSYGSNDLLGDMF